MVSLQDGAIWCGVAMVEKFGILSLGTPKLALFFASTGGGLPSIPSCVYPTRWIYSWAGVRLRTLSAWRIQ